MFDQFKVTVYEKAILDLFMRFKNSFSLSWHTAKSDYNFGKLTNHSHSKNYYSSISSNPFIISLKLSNLNGVFHMELLLKNSIKNIAKWEIDDSKSDVFGDGTARKFLEQFGIKDVSFEQEIQHLSPISIAFKGQEALVYKYTRLTKPKQPNFEARSLEFFILNKDNSRIGKKWSMGIRFKNIENGFIERESVPVENHEFSEIVQKYDELMSNSLETGFVKENDYRYIPNNANSSNWNFLTNTPQSKNENSTNKLQTNENAEKTNKSINIHNDEDLNAIFSNNRKKLKISQYRGNGIGPTGSDLNGRMGNAPLDQSQPSWGFLQNFYSRESLEARLSREFMWPLAKDIDQNHQHINIQLEKQFKNDPKQNPKSSLEESLVKDRDIYNSSYKSIEQLLAENRPHPLMKTIKKASMTKEALLFGWYNNFDISDGKTLEGMGDRVYKFEQIEEELDDRSRSTRHQERYNPSYDANGFYYKFIDFKGTPYLFDDPTRDYKTTHPARRFAGKDSQTDDIENTTSYVMQILRNVNKDLSKNKFKAVRFIISEDLLNLINEIFENCHVEILNDLNSELGDEARICWISKSQIENLEEAESFFKGDESKKQLIDDLTGIFSYNTKNVLAIKKELQEICLDQNISSSYLIGEMSREIIDCQNEQADRINSKIMDIGCDEGCEDDLKVLAQYLSEKIGESIIVTDNDNLMLNYNGIQIIFYTGSIVIPKEFQNKSKLECIVLNRDLTINSIGINLFNNNIFDPFDNTNDILNKLLKCNVSVEKVKESNPNFANKIEKMIEEGWNWK